MPSKKGQRKPKRKPNGGSTHVGQQQSKAVPHNALVAFRPIVSVPASARPRPKSARKGRAVNPAVMSRVMHYIHSMCNPFDSRSRGCLRRDSYAMPRLPVRAESLIKLNTTGAGNSFDASGSAGLWFFPNVGLVYQFVYTTGGAGATWVLPVNANWKTLNNSSPDTTNTATGRVNCAGLRIRPNLPATASVGTIVVTEVNQPGTTAAGITVGNLNGENVKVFTATPGLDIIALSRPLGPQSQLPQTVSTVSPVYGTWSGYFIQFYGFPTSGAGGIDIHMVENLEWFVDDPSTFVGQFARPPPPSAPMLEGIAAHVQTAVGGIVHSGIDAAETVLAGRLRGAIAGALASAEGGAARLAGSAPLLLMDG